ncbi:MAG: hypothetical protein NXH79_00405 [Rhodobacteraceae bacterium]|nr:hypothetical protein [Paracoccaceae bacterium]
MVSRRCTYPSRLRRGPWFPRGLILLVLGAMLVAAPLRADTVRAYVFWQEGCPYCEAARTALAEIAATDPLLAVEEIELGGSLEAVALFGRLIELFGIEQAGVPLVVIGDRYLIGFARDGRSLASYAQMIATCRAGPCPDIVADLRAEMAPVSAPQTEPEAGPAIPVADLSCGGDGGAPNAVIPALDLPVLGEVRPGDLSLPALTVVLAAVDGFNPCAMWVLALLIAFLLGVDDARRMWTLGAIFLLTTAAMYFAVMTAWLNVVTWIGAVGWLRLVIGALALAAGFYYLREYWTNPEGVCRVTPSDRRRSIRAAFQRVVEQPNLAIAGLGIAGLAIAVNLIELACSAGIPAVYTQMLAMQDLQPMAVTGYLVLYIGVFLLDDTAIFVTAMVTLRAVSGSARISRLSHLVGGIVLIALGAIMLLRPDLLAWA